MLKVLRNFDHHYYKDYLIEYEEQWETVALYHYRIFRKSPGSPNTIDVK
jgi:hypothetical protein